MGLLISLIERLSNSNAHNIGFVIDLVLYAMGIDPVYISIFHSSHLVVLYGSLYCNCTVPSLGAPTFVCIISLYPCVYLVTCNSSIIVYADTCLSFCFDVIFIRALD